MSIWVNENTKVVVQGITGKAAMHHTKQMLEYGTSIVAGVTPGKGNEIVLGIPVFNTVKESVDKTQANTSIIYVPAEFAAKAIIEAVDADIKLVICITEHIPIFDMLRVKEYMKGKDTRLIGPNCPGIIAPDNIKIGIMPGSIHNKGAVGVVSRSGTLTYEAVQSVTRAGFGQSSAVGIGGDPINGTSFIDVLSAFNEDKETKVVIMIGEIGGDGEERAAKWISENMNKPVIGFIAGMTAPKGKRMGHAGAIISENMGTATAKIEALELAGVRVVKNIESLIENIKEVMENNAK